MLTLYARKEPPRSPVLNLGGDLRHVAAPGSQDVVIYRDKAARLPFVRYEWHAGRRPDRRFRFITLNCYRWNLKWLPDVEGAGA